MSSPASFDDAARRLQFDAIRAPSLPRKHSINGHMPTRSSSTFLARENRRTTRSSNRSTPAFAKSCSTRGGLIAYRKPVERRGHGGGSTTKIDRIDHYLTKRRKPLRHRQKRRRASKIHSLDWPSVWGTSRVITAERLMQGSSIAQRTNVSLCLQSIKIKALLTRLLLLTLATLLILKLFCCEFKSSCDKYGGLRKRQSCKSDGCTASKSFLRMEQHVYRMRVETHVIPSSIAKSAELCRWKLLANKRWSANRKLVKRPDWPRCRHQLYTGAQLLLPLLFGGCNERSWISIISS